MEAKALIIYATCSGNTEFVAQHLAEGMETEKIHCTLRRVELASTAHFEDYDFLILASPTYNVGRLQEYFEPFYKELLSHDIHQKPCAAIALGKSSDYDIFCEAALYLEKAITKMNGQQIEETLKIDGDPYDRAKEWKQWGQKLGKAFHKHTQS